MRLWRWWSGAVGVWMALGWGTPLLAQSTSMGPLGTHEAAWGGTELQVGEGRQDEDPFTLTVSARIQVRHTQTDPGEGERTGSTRIRRGRLAASGEAYQAFDYLLQLEVGGAEARLIDAFVRYRRAPALTLWLGQGKAHFGRQQLASSRDLQFVDRTIVDDRFSAGRQQGVALTGRLDGDLLEYGVGVYDGNGINQPVNQNNRFMSVARLVLTPLGSYGPVESALDRPETPRLAVGASGFRNAVGERDAVTRLLRANGEVAFKWGGANVVGEAYREWAKRPTGRRDITDGWYVQGGYLLPGGTHELVVRYAEIQSGDVPEEERVETGVGYSHYLHGHRVKVQGDLRNVRQGATGVDHRELRVQFQLTL